MVPTKLLTTGDVARLSGFSPSAVLQWVRSGKLPSYSSPGGQHRVDPEDLLAFLHTHGMRVPPELARDGAGRVLVVAAARADREAVRRLLGPGGLGLEVEAPEAPLAACARLPVLRPHLLVLDAAVEELDPVEVCRWVKSERDLAATRILLLAKGPRRPGLRDALAAGAEAWAPKPLRPAQLVRTVAQLLHLRGKADQPAGTRAPAQQAPRP